MLLAGILFDVGVVLMAAAFNLGMLIAGRVLLGVAVAFASVAVTLYNSEMAPAHMRGRLNQIFQVGARWRLSGIPPVLTLNPKPILRELFRFRGFRVSIAAS